MRFTEIFQYLSCCWLNLLQAILGKANVLSLSLVIEAGPVLPRWCEVADSETVNM